MIETINEEAYVFIAYGEKYVKQVINLVKSLKRFDTIRKYVLISNIECHDLFDEIIDIQNDFIHENNTHNKYCVLARLFTPKYIKYSRFLMIDTDILCLNNPEYVWDLFKNKNECFSCIGGRDHDIWHWNNIKGINKKLELVLNPMHGGVIYFDQSNPKYKTYMEKIYYALNNYDKLGFKRMFRNNAMTDEIIFSYANAKLNIIPHDFVDYPVVSFCLNSNISINENIVSWGTKKTTFRTTHPTIFNHFTGLNDNNFEFLYNEWLNKLNIS